jgi:2-methylfumaryl-CoA isomerase
MSTAPLAGLRVLEVCAHAALPLGARTLAELGAEVIRIDPAGGRTETVRRAAAELLAASGPRGGIALTCTAAPTWLGHAELMPWRSDLIQLQVRHREDLAEDLAEDAKDGAAAGSLNYLPAWDVAYGLEAAAALLAADRHRRRTGQGHAINLTPQDVACAFSGHLGILAEAQRTRVHQVRIGGYRSGGFARDFGTAGRDRVILAVLSGQQFADLARVTRLASTFTFLERLLGADFSVCADRYIHRESIGALLAPWFARRTAAGLAAAFAGTSVSAERLPSFGARPASPPVRLAAAAVGRLAVMAVMAAGSQEKETST